MPKLTDEMKQMIATQQCFIATVREDGVPMTNPKMSMRVFDDEHLAYNEGTGRGTFANVKRFPKVSVAVIDRSVVNGFRFVGTVTLHDNDEIYQKAADAAKANGRPAPKAVGVIAVEEIYSLKPGPTAGTRIG